MQKPQNIKSLLPLIIFIILVFFLYIGLGNDPKKLPSPLINKQFPNIEINDFYSGDKRQVEQYINNKVTLINVWASWCITCRVEHKQLLSIAQNNDVYMLGINYKDDLVSAKKFLTNFTNPFDDIIFDHNGSLGLELGVYATPETFIVDKLGIIRYKFVGAITKDIMNNEIIPFINKLQS